MNHEFALQAAEPVFNITCEACGIIAAIGSDEEELIEDAKERGFVALHSEEGTFNLCRSCFEGDPELFTPKPIDMVLHCPNCGTQHIDEPERENCVCGGRREQHALISKTYRGGCLDPECSGCGEYIKTGKHCLEFQPAWLNPPHRSHLCSGCKTIWRPADVPTNGVEKIETRGKADTWPEVTR